jgi:hypothetical protein
VEAAHLAAEPGGNGRQDVLRSHFGYIGRRPSNIRVSCRA